MWHLTEDLLIQPPLVPMGIHRAGVGAEEEQEPSEASLENLFTTEVEMWLSLLKYLMTLKLDLIKNVNYASL